MTEKRGDGPLKGLVVLDFTAFIAGPYAGRLMADMGAEVIKIEPADGEATRDAPPVSNGMGGVFSVMNAGKKSVTLNLATPEGRDLAVRLSHEADVVLENFRPGVMKRLGLDYETLSKDHPRLVYCSVSGYGQTGPNAGGPAYAPIINAASGYALGEFRYQRATDKPEPTRSVAADVLAANHALIEAMGNPDWAAEPRFATPAGRLGNWNEITARVEVWAEDRTAEEAARLRAAKTI